MKKRNKRNQNKPNTEQRSRKIVVTFGCLLVALVAAFYIFTSPKVIPPADTENELESYLLRDVTSHDILPGFTPVIIYRFSPVTGEASVAGSGTMFTGNNGQQVVTAAHVFSVQDNGPTNQYAIRRMRPLEGHVLDLGIQSLEADGNNIPGFRETGNDVVLCSVGPHPQPISSFYEDSRGESEKQTILDMMPLKEAVMIRSLVSGQSVPIVGIGKAASSGLHYFIVILSSRPGESGTGFVDDKGMLYILKGSATTIEMTREAADRMGYPQDASYAIVVGPLAKPQ